MAARRPRRPSRPRPAPAGTARHGAERPRSPFPEAQRPAAEGPPGASSVVPPSPPLPGRHFGFWTAKGRGGVLRGEPHARAMPLCLGTKQTKRGASSINAGGEGEIFNLFIFK